MLREMLTILLITAGILLLCYGVRGALLTPVRLGKNMTLTLCLRVRGNEPALENTVDGLLWLMSQGTLPGHLCIEDDGMDEETRAVADFLTKDTSEISLWTRENNRSQ